MFSRTTEYALRAIVYLASKAPAPQTTVEIARATRVPSAYLAKVMQSLTRAELVHSQRGIRGGFSLSRDPGELSVLEVVSSVDPIRRIEKCPLDLQSHGNCLCPLHRRLDAALESVEKAFRESTLAEILAEPSESVPLSEFPRGNGPS